MSQCFHIGKFIGFTCTNSLHGLGERAHFDGVHENALALLLRVGCFVQVVLCICERRALRLSRDTHDLLQHSTVLSADFTSCYLM